MTVKMRMWLRDRGLTAIQIARRMNFINPEHIWYVLDGTMKLDADETQKLKTTLCDVYGMTEAEWKEALPWTA